MSNRVERLTQLRRHEQDSKGYPPSSRWYMGLSNALKFLQRAETETDHINRFREAWFAIYNLSRMIQIPGEEENKTLIKFSKEVETAPAIRSLSQDFSTSFLELLLAAKKQLLWDAQRNQWRESKQCVESWLQKRQKSQELSPEKACTYVFLILRDLRNAVSHFDSNPSSSATKKALNAAADQFIPLAAAAIESIIERPIKGTTGRTIAYHSFLYPFLKNSDSFFSDYYLERLFPEEELADFAEAEAKEQLKGIAREWRSRQSTLRTADENTTRQFWCESVLFPALGTTVHQGVTLVAEDGVFDPTYVLTRADSSGTPQAEYQGKDAKRDLACLIWVLPWLTSLDAISTNPEFESLPVMEVAHRALTASDVPWAILTNGQQLRLLSRRTAHKPRCFLEIDLAAVIDRRGDTEALLSFRYLLGLFAGASFTEEDEQGWTRLDRVVAGSDRHGQEISDELKQNVFGALEEIGDGFLDYLRNHPEELDAWRQEKYSSVPAEGFLSSEQLLTDIYQESLTLMYRLLFLFYAESRNLLPMEDEFYRNTYSLESIRDDIKAVIEDPDPTKFYGKGNTQLWQQLHQLFGFVNEGNKVLQIPAYNGGLFDPELHQFLERFQVGDYHLSRAIDLLSRTSPNLNRPRGLTKVTYRDLDIRHLGSIYEGILEYSAHIANQELVVMKRGTGNKVYEEYVPVSELKAEERQQLQAYREATEENPKLPRGCKVVGVKPQGSYFLVYGGRESKRKSSGSYYTPDYIVQYIVENTLGPLVRGENREGELKDKSLTANEILELKVLDPAMGSGHFLVAATEFLARAYGEALIKEGRDDDGVMSDEEFVRYKRIVAERCIYGVDLNPMAVELAKLSMWLFTMDRNRPLSFLNHHLKLGNALIGAWIEDLAELPEFDRKGKPKKRQKSPGQLNMFEGQFKARVPVMVRDLFGIMRQETLTYQDVQDKKALDQAIEEMKRPFKNLADMWVGTFFGEQPRDYYALLANVEQARDYNSTVAEEIKFFHWELEFPEVFFNENGRNIEDRSFDAVIGNPPYGALIDTNQAAYIMHIFDWVQYRPETYLAFAEQAEILSVNFGFSAMIIPDNWMYLDFTENMRVTLLDKRKLQSIVALPSTVFPDATVDTSIFISGGLYSERVSVTAYHKKTNIQSRIKEPDFYEFANAYLKSVSSIINPYLTPVERSVVDKIRTKGRPLADVAEVKYGLKAYQVGKGTPPQTRKIVEEKPFNSNIKVNDHFSPYLEGADIGRYEIFWNEDKWIYWGPWLAEPRSQNIFSGERLLFRKVVGYTLIGTFIERDAFSNTLLYVIKPKGSIAIKVILAILNSILMGFYFRKSFAINPEDTFPQILIDDICVLPIAEPNNLESNQLESLISAILDKKEVQKNSQLIDELVYQLYGLNSEDIKTVELAFQGMHIIGNK